MVYDKSEIDDILNNCEEYRAKLVQHCMTILDYNRTAAQDCVQEAYLELFLALRRGNEIQDHKAWLYKVTLNKRNQFLKEAKSRKEVPLSDSAYATDAFKFAVEQNITEPSISYEAIEKMCITVLNGLSDEEKSLYMDIYVYHKKQKDIASEKGRGLFAVKKRHERLKKKLRMEIKKEIEKNY